jgi:hypothetical protein
MSANAKAAEDCRTAKAGVARTAPLEREASWSAAVVCRFSTKRCAPLKIKLRNTPLTQPSLFDRAKEIALDFGTSFSRDGIAGDEHHVRSTVEIVLMQTEDLAEQSPCP